ncbi:hypothetical protein M409DRAFT_21633 [Zasmidium cellare ATCC 36951]|uniref:AB hydrolase-1 domain-containing protein n=1 Tax=Zasmidium cellare ATCC 36951 TaxID=1080233 RepID=A0A6A6CQY5_ZASCE|nr:uncharacterized protein M409DRAFT_21633 [Zasmidium cellare ATCC 36951]KAF2168189.1 hypothetical protein M409DRAFT_21633 [Zasmidium cellare ATCC 36951]
MTPSKSNTFTLVLSDGRTLAYETYGVCHPNQSTSTAFYFHGLPGSRLEAAAAASHVTRVNLRIISIDRPGFGLSTPRPGRILLDWPKDVAELADHLGLEKFHLLGVSGGGPYVFACLKEIPERIINAAVVCSAWPFDLGTAGMRWATWFLLKTASVSWLQGVVAFLLDWEMGDLARETEHPERFVDAFMKAMSAPDRPAADAEVLQDEVLRAQVIAATREAFRQSSIHSAWEAGLYDDWKFQLSDLDFKGRLEIWHGRLHVNVPVAMAEKAAARMPWATLHLVEDVAHLSLPARYLREILSSLVGVQTSSAAVCMSNVD